ncbi:MAG TPA: hypothetical protein ENK18_26105 [Deltaproteobacteria bacterium]|nr:hypothetical protein [Deltaproteobacteria bacterium]
MDESPLRRSTDWLRRALPVVVGVILAAALCLWVDPISRNDSHYGRMVLAGISAAMVVAWWGVSSWGGQRARRGLQGTLAALCTVGWFNYYQFDAEVLTGIGDYTDTTYYYTNSKYLPELSYYGLYGATLLCEAERGSPRTAGLQRYRDLRDYEIKPISVGLEHGRQLKAEAFTEQRWASFCHDITWFLDRLDDYLINTNFFVDHGYNPPPTWTVVGGNLASLVPVERIKLICTVDMVWIAGMFGCIAWAFGIETCAFAMLFYVVTFSGRWPILGQALMRFDWVAALVCSMCFLARGWHGLAGASLGYAALNRVFPAIFFLGWGLDLLRELVQQRRIAPRHRRFAAGVAVVSITLLGTSLIQYGPATFAASARNLAMHNETYSSHRVGLGDLLLFRGETTRAEIRAGGGIYAKELKIRAMQWPLRLAGLLAIGFIALYARRTRRGAWELFPLAILPFFCMTNPQINYYNLRLLLFVWHGARIDRPIHRVLMVLLFLVEVVTQWTRVVRYDRYTTTTTTSVGLAVYFVVLIGAMLCELRSRPERCL